MKIAWRLDSNSTWVRCACINVSSYFIHSLNFVQSVIALLVNRPEADRKMMQLIIFEEFHSMIGYDYLCRSVTMFFYVHCMLS